MKKIFLFISLILTLSLNAQMSLNRDTVNLKIKENSVYFKSPFAGGINAGQFSEIDLNLDGIMDLIVFDKSGNKIIPFINNGLDYIFAPIYRENFPKNLHDWLLLADYNCDGKNDIFTYSNGGLAVYENTSTNSLTFNIVTPLIMTDIGSFETNLWVSPDDIPAIIDVDNDGDLDILTYGLLGGFIELHKNLSIEKNGNCDSISFKKSENCWGYFYEGLNDYILNCQNCQCPQISHTNLNEQIKHPGSTILALDIDNDNDNDVVIGDINSNKLNLLINGGDNTNAFMIDVDTNFPSNHNNTVPVDLNFFPSSFYLDIDNDGKKDLIASTNARNYANYFESIWLYKNTGSNNNPEFNFIENNFLQKNMIDLGKGANPIFYDYNNDNLLDLIIGNHSYFNLNGSAYSSLALFENTGTNINPEFNLIDRDWLNLSNINLNIIQNIPAQNLTPTFGDVDGDGDHDLIVGDKEGLIHLFENISGSYQIVSPNYFNIDVGYTATPQLVDVNRDGLIDLIIGSQDGTINYYPNNGTVFNATFDSVITNFGGVDVDSAFINDGFSSPKLIDSSGVYQLFVGSYSGKIYQFTNIDNNLNGVFTEQNSIMSTIWDGKKCSFDLKDINGDNQPELLLGNLSGGITYFSSKNVIMPENWKCILGSCIDPADGSGQYQSLLSCQNNCTYNETRNYKNDNIEIFPNPTKNKFTISILLEKDELACNIYDNLGKKILSEQKIDCNITCKKTFDFSSMKKGIYLIEIKSKQNIYYKKISIQ